MEYVAETERNPFGLSPPCDRYVSGYGDVNADFHVIGDSPRVHGGLETGIPFTDMPWSERFFEALCDAELIQSVDLDDGELTAYRTFFSYIHMCDEEPDADSYARMEPFFDAELRAITAHVLLPVGARATAHVLGEYTAVAPHPLRMDERHATEIKGSGWLVIPISDPADWTDADAKTLVERVRSLEEADFRQLSDLGRFRAGADPYFVR